MGDRELLNQICRSSFQAAAEGRRRERAFRLRLGWGWYLKGDDVKQPPPPPSPWGQRELPCWISCPGPPPSPRGSKRSSAGPESITSTAAWMKEGFIVGIPKRLFGEGMQSSRGWMEIMHRDDTKQQSATNPKPDCLSTPRTYIPTYKTSERHYGNWCDWIKNPFTLRERERERKERSVMFNSSSASEEEEEEEGGFWSVTLWPLNWSTAAGRRIQVTVTYVT